jgi:hypothetical protein
MAYTLQPTRLAYVMLAIEALIFAGKQPGTSTRTREKIAIALASAKRDSSRIKSTNKKTQRQSRRVKRTARGVGK